MKITPLYLLFYQGPAPPKIIYHFLSSSTNRKTGKSVVVLGKKIFGAWPLIIWEATTAKRNYYRTWFGGLCPLTST